MTELLQAMARVEAAAPAAAVQLNEGGVLRGTFDMVPWGFDDQCYRVTLESGQRLLVWLEGVTSAPEAGDQLEALLEEA